MFDRVHPELYDHFLAEAQPYLGLWLDGAEGTAPAFAMENVVALPSLEALPVGVSSGEVRLLYPIMLMLGSCGSTRARRSRP